MEREGRGRRGRRGGEMRRGIVIGGMALLLMLGCNNGIAELEKEKETILSISNLRQGVLDAFVSFGGMVNDVLGIKAETKKEDIGKYFTKIAETMGAVKEKLQSEVAKNGNYEKVKTVVDKFIKETLEEISSGAKEAAKGSTTGDSIGNTTVGDATPASQKSVVSLVKGIKTIVDVVLKDKGIASADKTTGNNKEKIGHLFTDNSGKGEAKEENVAKASASIGAVSGADILQAISKSKEEPTIQEGIQLATDAAEIAVVTAANNKTIDKSEAKKDAVIAAGIALRAMADNGKFSANAAKDAEAVKGVAASAVTKALSTLLIAIRDKVDSGLKKINEALKSVNQGDMLPETRESGAAKK